ncbi:uncharacterized protein LOC103831429 isoform X2 [Brassica rapa]|uniref:uncharacterized protein LOC103831429 isoform X2 n=1 Tax=Brassica campestris TaxID=3711 RepID=UPI00142D20A6|nr:uncharacterized protein LOC103831429 isoform X2 [Brassica rapa]
MESSLGLKEVSIKDSTSKDLDMVTEFTGSTPEILTPVNGLTVKAMSLVSNMDLVLTTSEMEISTQESTLETRFMGLVFAISLMVTITKELGTKVVSNAMARMDL